MPRTRRPERARARRHARRRRVRASRLAPLLILVGLLAVVAVSVTGYAAVLGCRVRLQPGLRAAPAARVDVVRRGRGRELARGDRVPRAPRARPARLDLPVARRRDGGHRGPAVLAPRGPRPRGDPARRGRGHQGGTRGRRGIDDHPAAGAQPLLRHRRPPDPGREDPGDLPRAQPGAEHAEGPDPRRVPQPRVLRERRVRSRGGRPDVLLPPGEQALPAAGGPARGPAPGALRLRPDGTSRGCPRPAERGAGGDALDGRDLVPAVPDLECGPARARAGRPLSPHSSLALRSVRGEPPGALPPGAAPRGWRPDDPHHARPRSRAHRQPRPPGAPAVVLGPGGRAGGHRSADRRDPGHGRTDARPAARLRPARTGAARGGERLQALHARDRPRERDLARVRLARAPLAHHPRPTL